LPEGEREGLKPVREYLTDVASRVGNGGVYDCANLYAVQGCASFHLILDFGFWIGESITKIQNRDYHSTMTFLPVSALRLAAKAIATLFMLSVQIVSGVLPSCKHRTKSCMRAVWPDRGRLT